MGELVDLDVVRKKPRCRYITDGSLSLTTSGPLEIQGYSYAQCASVLLSLATPSSSTTQAA